MQISRRSNCGSRCGRFQNDLLDKRFWRWGELHLEIEEIARGSFKRREPPEIRGSGFVVHTLEAALWALYKSASFEEGALLGVNLGEDADMTGAVYGQLAGAVYGEFGIPLRWRERLALREVIEGLPSGFTYFPGSRSPSRGKAPQRRGFSIRAT
jgi:hypothetical protein